MKKLFFNPFEKNSETRLLVFGLIITAIGSYLGYLLNGRYDGVIDLHFTKNTTLAQPFIDNLINIVSLFAVLFLVGKLINSKTRIIDILSPILISRIPFYLLTFFNFRNYISDVTASIVEKLDLKAMPTELDLSPVSMILLMLFAMISILCLVWFIILLYNGFKIATNCKTIAHKLYFALAIVAAEIISKILISLLTY
ncbi:hypothetical protein [Flavobacterium microcysteis]|uniref:Yip1 domain-containing protein n=1 Tax=Flavobacterium microcysteis TaxID=2596891 RepID=A0A501QCA0_9FLAO|nr:hypothetical protein [Flavobacterium microcysteis]TPD69721.1 hypothetical protein FJA49_07370 [Flavobacterium microcysteis]